MIMYFSGTGNSEYAAKRIAAAINDECINLFESLKSGSAPELCSDKPFVTVSPTYGWQIPHILRDWLKKVSFSGSRDMYFVMTCGGEIGNAKKYLKKLCADIGLNYKGCAEIVMPENYVAMFYVPGRDEALNIVNRAEPVIDKIAEAIAAGKPIPDKPAKIADRLKSGIVNTVYYPLCLHADKFIVSEKCISCGKCVKSCVMNNIRLVDGKPVWGDKCTHCMACICLCPKEAIEYGKKSKGKPRYVCPKKI